MADSKFAKHENDDLAALTKLDEQILVEQLRERYEDDRIYTYIGDILVAVNPFRPLTIYERVYSLKYRGITRADAPPHIFAVADQGYHLLLHTNKSQCCVVSGESGAGKTESAKLIIRHIINLCPAADTGSDLESRILQVNPLLEAFGNAQTNMNDNSSRFGKYTELVFNGAGAVLGAEISEYLLEKSRVVYQQEGEQNFHIFYYLFASPDCSKYMLETPDKYLYLRNVDGLDEDNESMLQEVVVALTEIGFKPEDKDVLFTCLAAIMTIGNIQFESKDEHDPAKLAASASRPIGTVAMLLRVDEKKLQDALLFSINVTRGETIKRNYNAGKAYDVRDAWAKALYGRLFSWLVGQLNVLLKPPAPGAKGSNITKAGVLRNTIGILDIYGFENFAVNSFEQMCINLANEQLQHFFNDHVFQLELEEYEREGIDGANITFVDNGPLLKLFLEKPIGLFKLLDEETVMPKATDNSLVQKYIKNFASNERFIRDKSDGSMFSIEHYAGRVEYTAVTFLEKNRDSLAADIVNLMQQSGLSVVSDVFLGEVTSDGSLLLPSQKSSRPDSRGRTGTGTSSSATKSNTFSKRSPTLATQFRNSLQELVAKMTACRPHFVRCIKPNTGKAPWNFQDDFVMIQLNYTGMLETTRIRREGYAVRPQFKEFLERYKMLGYGYRDKPDPTPQSCIQILDKVRVQGWLMGKTKVFLKYFHVEELDGILLMHHRMAGVLQKCLRGGAARQSHRVLVAEATRQREEAEAMLTSASTFGAKVHTSIKSICAQDLKMLKERQEQAAEMARKLAEKKRQEQANRAREEREKMEEERRALEARVTRTKSDYDLLNQKLKRWKSQVEVDGMDESRREEHKTLVSGVEEKLKEQREFLNQRMTALTASVTLLQKEKEAQEIKIRTMETQRDALVRKLSAKAEAGDTDAVADLRAQLRAQDLQIGDLREETALLTKRMATERSLLETAKTAHDEAVTHLNELLKQEHVIADAYRAELEKTKDKLEKEVTKARAESNNKLEELEAELADRDRTIKYLQDKLASQQDISEKTQSEHERTVVQLKKLLSSAEAEVTSVQQRLEHQSNLLDTTKSESGNMVQELKRMLADKEEMAERRQMELERANRQHEGRVTEVRDEAEQRQAGLNASISQLRSDLLTMEAQLRSAVSEKESAVRELSAKVEMGEAEAASHLRVKLRAEELRVEEKEAEVARLSSRLDAQKNMSDLTRGENEQLVKELKRLLADKEEIAERSRDEHSKVVKSLNVTIDEYKEKLEKYGSGLEGSLQQLKTDVQQKDRQLQAAISDKETVVREITTKFELVNAEVEAEKARLHAKSLQLDEARGEVSRLNNRLQQQAQQLDDLRDERDRSVNQTTSQIRERDMELETIKLDGERAQRAANQRAQTLQDEIGELREDNEKAMRKMQEDFDMQADAMQRLQAERDAQMQELKEQLAAESRAHAELQEQVAERDQAVKRLEADNEAAQEELKLKALEDEKRRVAEDEVRKQREAEEAELAAKAAKKASIKAEKMIAAIRGMGRKRPGSQTTPREQKSVDLIKYMGIRLSGASTPGDMVIGRFTCKSFLSKLSVKTWQRRWFVFDLQARLLTWYADNRELRIQSKGSIPLGDMTKTIMPKKTDAESNNDFLIVTRKRTYHFRAESPEMKNTWIMIIESILPA